MLATQMEVSDGTLSSINVGIHFFSEKDISVSLGESATPLMPGIEYIWTADNTIVFQTSAATPGGFVPAGVTVIIRRDTKNDEMYNILDGGAPFSRLTLDENYKQLLYLTQEFSEGLGLDGIRNVLNMHNYRIINLGNAQLPSDAINKGQVDTLVETTGASIRHDFTTADAALQDQLLGVTPPAGSQFSPISWHPQHITASMNIPENMNAWSFGPTMTIDAGQVVTVGNGSFWTIADGEVQP